MPTNTEIVKCPVCQVDKQVGLVAHHICKTHTHDGKFDENLQNLFTNPITNGTYHPEITIGGRIFTLCPAWEKEAKGFRHESKNKRSLQNQHNGCQLCYKGWLGTSNVIIPPKEPSSELDRLREENRLLKLDLDKFRNWLRLIPYLVNFEPSNVPPAVNSIVEPAVQQLAEEVTQPAEPAVVPPPVQPRKVVKASKKEIAKGMWCTRCESCETLAQFATDLKACARCQKLCHYNDDLNSCYHWDCEICAKRICKECNKSNGGNKMHPLCSPECAKKYKDKRNS